MAGLKAISADSHVQEAPELFETRVPEEFRPRLPHMEEGEDGAKYRVVEGRKKRRFDIAAENINEDDMEREFRLDPSGGTDIPYRLKDQDRDGVTAEVLYPNSLLALFAAPDPKYQIAVARAYNDWAIELFGGHADRFAPAGLVPVIDVPTAVEEVKRVAGLGYKLISAPIHLKHQPYSLPVYEPLWNVLEETGLPISLHFISGSEDHLPEGAGEEQAWRLPHLHGDRDGRGNSPRHRVRKLRGAGPAPEPTLRNSGVRRRLAALGAVHDGRPVRAEAHVDRAEAGHEAQRVLQAAGSRDIQ